MFSAVVCGVIVVFDDVCSMDQVFSCLFAICRFNGLC